jgi:hypothetical protein
MEHVDQFDPSVTLRKDLEAFSIIPVSLPCTFFLSILLSLPLLWSLVSPASIQPFLNTKDNPTSPTKQPPSAWESLVSFHPWLGTELDDPDACSIKHLSFMPEQDGRFQLCSNNKQGFSGFDYGPWGDLLQKELNTFCVYHRQSHERHKLLTLPSPNATVYFVYVTSTILSFRRIEDQPSGPVEDREWPALKASRWFHLNWTLSRLRHQFGGSIEITLVTMDEEEPIEGVHISPGVVNTLVWNVMDEGQDWRLYQVGLHEAWHRLHRFSWVFVGNDQMVGPSTHFPTVVENLIEVNAGSWYNSANQGFMLGFSKALVAENRWRLFWERARWPCAKTGPMMIGEGAIYRAPQRFQDTLSGAWCRVNTMFGKGASLEHQKNIGSPHFWYRWGLENQFLPNACYNRPCQGGGNTTETRESAMKKLELSRQWLEAEENSAPAIPQKCKIEGGRGLLSAGREQEIFDGILREWVEIGGSGIDI